MSASLFLDAVMGKPTPEPVVGSGTSIVTEELMDITGVSFPEAHQDSELMAKLAIGGYTVLGYDNVMPLFSVCHDSVALGCPVNWGDRRHMPDCRNPIWKTDEDVKFTKDFLKHPSAQVPLGAISILKKQLGDDCAVCGKVFGPWTLGYHLFGIEDFLINTLLEPDMIRRAIDKLKQVTVWYAEAQIEAGADCLLLADHATRDLCSPEAYRDFLMDVHKELVERINCPLILHICGDTTDRVKYIRKSRIDCFHWDTKCGSSKDMRQLAGDKLSLMGGVSNIEILHEGGPEEVKKQTQAAADAGINIVGPECAVPLDVRVENLKAISEQLK
ncbi:MAG: MtaA/CmuA family methyltransferase [Sedimentisphaerales bacterium]|nr:MtaA/CmuA family methyltransferase [Sedimentisphaerales bacterium]